MRLWAGMVMTAGLLAWAGCDAEPAATPDAKAEADAAGDVEGDAADDSEGDAPDDAGPDLLEGTVPAPFTVRPGVETVTVVGARPGAPLTLYDATGRALLTLLADEHGQAHWSYLPAEHQTIQSGDFTQIPVADGRTVKKGDGFVIRDESTDPVEAAGPFSVLGVWDKPDPALYDSQELHGITYGLFGLGDGETELDGFNYITMRDGVQLSAMVRFPDPIFFGDGPYPTVIEYSGYSPSHHQRPDPGSRIANLMGYATVGVNMRGSGCSGGVFDVFNPAQHADGHDIIEAVARQPWVLHGEVGMVGLSYSGIAQLFAAWTRPPSLAAITPQSVLADAWEQLWPGGIYNDGFTRQWIEERDAQAASGGQSWTDDVIAAGDTVCAEHQVLRNQNIDFGAFFSLLEHYPGDAADRSLPHLVGEIDAPVYLTGAWQDEQTGALFANMLDAFDRAPTTKLTVYNGRHIDGYSPLVLTRWFEFLELYVARRVPRVPEFMREIGAQELSKEFGVEGLGFEPDRFTAFTDEQYDEALAWYESEPPVRVLFENGAAGPAPGAPQHRFEVTFDSWPPPDAQGHTLWLAADGRLTDAPPTEAGADAWLHDPAAGKKTFFGKKGYQLFAPLWDIDWTEFPDGHAVSYVTEPLTDDLVIAGSPWVEVHVVSEADDVQVQVTLTEVRPDDTEVLVQSGWLRLGHRHIDEAASDEFRIVHTYEAEHFQPVVPGEIVTAKVPIYPVAHAFRAGARLRLTVSSPGRNHGTWEFAPPDYGDTQPLQTLLRTPAHPSRLHLPVVTGVPVADGFPECPSERGQPCRPYTPRTNTPGEVPAP